MAHEIKIDVYTLQVKRQKVDEFVGFNEFYKKVGENENELESKDFQSFFTDYINSFDNKFWVQAITGKAINLTSARTYFNSKEHIIYGLLEGGHTGIGSKIKNQSDISDENAFVVTTDMVDATPFYFLLWLPTDSNKGLMLVKSYGTKTVSETFRIHLKHFFNNNTKSLVLVSGDLIPKETIKKMEEEGIVNTIVLRRQHLPSNKSEKLLGLKYVEDKSLSIEIKITGLGKIKVIRDKIRKASQGIFTNIIETSHLEDIGFDENFDIIAKFEHEGKTTVGKLSKNFKIEPSYYVDEKDIKRDNLKHPVFESIDNYCKGLLETLKKEIGYKKTK